MSALLQRRGVDRREGLDPAVEVAGHPVGRADVPGRLARAVAVGEAEDAGVLEVAAHDRPHPDALGQARDARAQAADAPDDQVDLDAGLRGLVEVAR